MKYLLDTHAVLWYIGEDPQLPVSLRKRIEDTSSRCYVSIASLWEIGIKSSRLPLHHNDPFDRMIISQCLAEQMTMVSCDKQFQHYNLPVIWNRSIEH